MPVSTPASAISLPRRARAGPAQVTTWAAFTKRKSLTWETTNGRLQLVSRHHIANARDAERSLRLATARVVTRVAIDRLVLPECCPVKVRRKIRTPFDVA